MSPPPAKTSKTATIFVAFSPSTRTCAAPGMVGSLPLYPPPRPLFLEAHPHQGLQSFKMLLDQAVVGDANGKAKLAILQRYLEAVKPRVSPDDDADAAVYLPDLMDMWSFAVQVNDDGVMSSVAVVLALLLRAVSESLQLVPHGLGVCRTLLQERQLKSLARNLSAEKAKAFIISPTLRLLREAVCLDGGAYARRIVRERTYTFASLARNLEIGHAADGQTDARRASVRTNAVRLFLSCLKHLHTEGRRELLAQRELLSHVTYMIRTDPPHLVLEILDTLKTHVLADAKLPRDVKFKSFNTKTLLRFLTLYNYSNPTTEDSNDRDAVVDKTHEFLLYICTSPSAGVLYPCKGLYPKESDDEGSRRGTTGHGNHVGADHWEGRFRHGIPVYNFVLSEFAAKLRPWSSLKHSELLVATFAAAPELIADYFFNNRSFTFEPKLSMTWIGYAAFLFNTMTLPLPASFGDAVRFATTPPPTSIILDNVIPPAINEKVLVRCLSANSHLTSFFATRILVAALEKLNEAVGMLEASPSRNKRGSAWSEAARRLIDGFCHRIPDMKEIVRCYKGIPTENTLHRALASRLLRLYYKVIPRVALAANFDVSPLFVEILKDLYRDKYEPGIRALAIVELENLVSMASYSPGMRWFSRIDGLGQEAPLSPFTALLGLLCGDDRDTPYRQLTTILSDVAIENQLVSRQQGLKPLLRASQGLAHELDAKKAVPVWSFIDSCINRCATSPIKYLDQLQSHSEGGGHLTSLLSVAFVEQLPYATAAAESTTLTSLGRFLSLYFTGCHLWGGGDRELLGALYQGICRHLSSNKVELADLGDGSVVEALQRHGSDADADAPAARTAGGSKPQLSESALEDVLHVPFSESGDATALVRWTTKSVEDLVEDGWAASLVGLLSSEHTNIRKEALTGILKMAARIKESSYEEKTQLWLLLSELAESSRAQVEAGPVPSSLTAFTIHAMDVLKSPLHPLYPKVNAFLTRSPVWPLEKLPLAHEILHGEPSEDDRYYAELAWLLSYLLDSLRTPFDLGVFHKKKWLEKILALGSNPYLRSRLQARILRIVYRATRIDGGSTTLVTRFGVLSWLSARRAACEGAGDDADVLGELMRRVWDTCDQDRVTAWSHGGVGELIEGL